MVCFVYIRMLNALCRWISFLSSWMIVWFSNVFIAWLSPHGMEYNFDYLSNYAHELQYYSSNIWNKILNLYSKHAVNNFVKVWWHEATLFYVL